MNFQRIAGAAALLIAASGNLTQAVDLEWGLQGTYSLPQSDLSTLVDSGKGLGLGFFCDFPVQGPHAIRLRADYIQYPATHFADPFGGPTDDRTWSTRSLGGEYLFHTSGGQEGLYLSAGLGLAQFRQDIKFGGVSDSSQTSKLAWSLGLGYQVGRHWEANARYTYSSIGLSQGSITMAAMNLGAAYRF